MLRCREDFSPDVRGYAFGCQVEDACGAFNIGVCLYVYRDFGRRGRSVGEPFEGQRQGRRLLGKGEGVGVAEHSGVLEEYRAYAQP